MARWAAISGEIQGDFRADSDSFPVMIRKREAITGYSAFRHLSGGW